MSGCRAGEAGAGGTGRDEDQSGSEQAQSDELQADERGRGRLQRRWRSCCAAPRRPIGKRMSCTGPGRTRRTCPAELARRETRLQRLREAKAELEKEATEGRAAELRQQAERQRARIDDESLPDHERKRSRTRAEKAERQADAFPPEKKDRDEGDSSQQELPLHRVASEVNGKAEALRRSTTSPIPTVASWSKTGPTFRPTTHNSSWMRPIK